MMEGIFIRYLQKSNTFQHINEDKLQMFVTCFSF